MLFVLFLSFLLILPSCTLTIKNHFLLEDTHHAPHHHRLSLEKSQKIQEPPHKRFSQSFHTLLNSIDGWSAGAYQHYSISSIGSYHLENIPILLHTHANCTFV
jgi:hypothetical protein